VDLEVWVLSVLTIVFSTSTNDSGGGKGGSEFSVVEGIQSHSSIPLLPVPSIPPLVISNDESYDMVTSLDNDEGTKKMKVVSSSSVVALIPDSSSSSSFSSNPAVSFYSLFSIDACHRSLIIGCIFLRRPFLNEVLFKDEKEERRNEWM